MLHWLEDHLHRAGWCPLPSSQQYDLATLAYRATMYREVEGHEAWKDYQFRLKQMYEGIKGELLDGTLDKYGRSNDDSKRAILYYLAKQLEYVPRLLKEYEEADLARLKREAAMVTTPFKF